MESKSVSGCKPEGGSRVADFFLTVPDDILRSSHRSEITGDPSPPIDAHWNIMMFAKEFPALLGPDRMPINYRTFKSGVVVISRLNAIDQLKMSRATRAGQVGKEDFEKWIEEKLGQAGIPIVPPEEY